MSAPLHFHSGVGGEVCSQGRSWRVSPVLVSCCGYCPCSPPSPAPPQWLTLSPRLAAPRLCPCLEIGAPQPAVLLLRCLLAPAPLRKGRLPSGLMRLHRSWASDDSRARLLRQSPSTGSTAVWLWGVVRLRTVPHTALGVPGPGHPHTVQPNY